MPPNENILQRLHTLLPALTASGARSVSLFGSAARGEMRSDSDVDILIEFDRTDARLFFDTLFFLEQALGRKVDLVTPDGLHQRIRQRVLQEAIRVT